MPANRIRVSDLVPNGDGGSAGIGVKTDKRFYINRDGSNDEPIATDKIKIVTANTTLTAEDDGCTVIIDTATSVIVSLPATAAGLKFAVVIKTPTTIGNLHSVSPAALDKLMGDGFAALDNKDAQNTQASAKQGDALELVGDGVDGYLIKATGTWAREA